MTHTGFFMRPVFEAARLAPRRISYAEGEDERVLRAVQAALDEKPVGPILIGRPAVIAARIERTGLRIEAGRDFELIDPEENARFRQYWEAYYRLSQRERPDPAEPRRRQHPFQRAEDDRRPGRDGGADPARGGGAGRTS